jgi:hypothetical protein
MPIPTYDKFIEPILRHLAEHPEGASAATLYEVFLKQRKRRRSRKGANSLAAG